MSGCDGIAVSFRREPRVREHPPQVDGHLLIDVLGARWFEDLGLGSQRDLELAIVLPARRAYSLEQREHLSPLDVGAGRMTEDLLQRVAMTVAEVRDHG
jgi:hypothetical protein